MKFPELDQKKIIEIFLGLILIILLVILVFTITNPTASAKPQSTTITNSFNNYNLEYNYNQQTPRTYYKNLDYHRTSIDYTSHEKHETFTGIAGNNVDKYTIYINNKATSRYFTVTFIMEDKDHEEHSYSKTKYIPRGEEIKFTFTDVNERFRNWNYKVEAH